MGIADKLVRKVLGRVLRGGAPPPAHVPPPRPEPPPVATEAPSEDDLEVEVPVPGSLLLDIREPGEFASGVAEGAMLLPMDLVPHHLDALPRDRPLTIYCAAGARSWGVAHWLREQGFAQAYSLAGGIGVFRTIDVPVAPPPGLMPGTRVRLPADARAGDVPVGDGLFGEVIQQVDDHVEVMVRDTQGFPVRVTAAVWAVTR